MDIEYIQNVLGSPYVNEGTFDRLKAKGAQAMGSIGAMAGYQVKNPTETKLKSLWDGFMASLERVMTDWKTQVSPMLGSDVKLDATSRQIRKNLDALSQTLTPYEVGAYQSSVKPNPSALKTLTKEGMWDAAKRSMGLNKALVSNNPSVIANSYKNYVLSLFQNFVKDAIKSTGLGAQQIYQTLAKMQPKESGWQAAGNMAKVVKSLQKLQGPKRVPPVIPPQPVPTEPTATPPPLPLAAAPTSSPSVPPSLPPATTAASSTSTPPHVAPTQPKPSQTAPTASEPPVGGPSDLTPSPQQQSGVMSAGFDIPSKDMPFVILKALSIIVDATKSDKDHAVGLFGYDPHTKTQSNKPPLATAWGTGPALTASLDEITAGPKSNQPVSEPIEPGYTNPDIEAQKAANDDVKYKEFDKEFLYNFHSRYSKYPSAPFSIRVDPVNVSPNIDHLGASVEVWWHNQGSLNKIYVVEIKDNQKSNPTLIIKFYDHEVVSKMGATTPGHTNFFSIEKVVQKANPSSASKLSGAPKDVMTKIRGMEDDVLRSLMAVTHRKRMEFKSKGWAEKKEKETGKVGEDGSYSYVNPETRDTVTVTQDQLITLLKGRQDIAKKWRDRVDAVGYDDLFPDVLPIPAEKTEIWKDAVNQLKLKGYDDKKARNRLANAWLKIREKIPTASIWKKDANVTADALASIAEHQSELTPKIVVGLVPNALDAVKSLVALGNKEAQSFNWVSQAIEKLGVGKTTQEYLQAALSTPKNPGEEPPKTTPPTTPQPKPSAEPPQPKPEPIGNKYKVGDKVDIGGGNVGSIKYIGSDNVVIVLKGQEYTISAVNWNNLDKEGGIKLVNNPASTSVSGAAGGPPPSSPVSAPASGPAPTTAPTAPVSQPSKKKAPEQPTQEQATWGKLSIEGDKLVWTKGNDTFKYDADQVANLITSDAFQNVANANPKVYKKFVNMTKKKGKGKTQEGIEYVNPFQWENFV